MQNNCCLSGRLDVKAFTLIELLVVVLIIGILAAVAVPQYQKAVEKARMTEAVMLVRTIANANQAYYLANGRYARAGEMEVLDIEIPGNVDRSWNSSQKRIKTKNFIYSPSGDGAGAVTYIALAQRVPRTGDAGVGVYAIYITNTLPDKIQCGASTYATAIQRKLCNELNAKGTL